MRILSIAVVALLSISLSACSPASPRNPIEYEEEKRLEKIALAALEDFQWGHEEGRGVIAAIETGPEIIPLLRKWTIACPTSDKIAFLYIIWSIDREQYKNISPVLRAKILVRNLNEAGIYDFWGFHPNRDDFVKSWPAQRLAETKPCNFYAIHCLGNQFLLEGNISEGAAEWIKYGGNRVCDAAYVLLTKHYYRKECVYPASRSMRDVFIEELLARVTHYESFYPGFDGDDLRENEDSENIPDRHPDPIDDSIPPIKMPADNDDGKEDEEDEGGNGNR